MGKKRIRYSFEEIVAMKVSDLRTKIYTYAIPCDGWKKREAYYRDVGVYDYIDAEFMPISIGEKWGGPDVTCFFKNEIVIPPELDGRRVELQVYVGGDSLVCVNGEPRQGLDPFRNSLVLTEKAKAGEIFKVEIESYCFYSAAAEGVNKRTFECSALTAIDKEVEKIHWDWKVALNLLGIRDLPEETADYIKEVFSEIINFIDTDTGDREVFITKLRKSEKILNEKIYNCDNFHRVGLIDLVGHSHLDIIYMWDYKEFVRKAGRTHATMLALMDEFPEFKFCQSQAVTYKEIKENYPTLYERIKKYVTEGRWEIIGAMWVEPDCNLPSGESFVRQLLEGRKFFEKEFGIIPKTVWLPDVFGNSYGMPQILAKSGIKYFVT